MKNRKILYLLLSTLLIAFVIVSYSLAEYINKHNLVLETSGTMPYLKLTAKTNSDGSLQASFISNLPKVAEDTKFVFKIIYKDKEVRNMVLEKHFNDSIVLNSKTQAELNELFKSQGYTVSNMSNHEIVFVNNSERYSYNANRYFLGVYNNLVTIYKTDDNGDIIAHKIFNSNVYAEDGKQRKYDFQTKDSGELQFIRINDLEEKDGLVEDLIRGRKYTKDINGTNIMEIDEEYEKGEFKSAGKAFDYARGLLKS